MIRPGHHQVRTTVLSQRVSQDLVPAGLSKQSDNVCFATILNTDAVGFLVGTLRFAHPTGPRCRQSADAGSSHPRGTRTIRTNRIRLARKPIGTAVRPAIVRAISGAIHTEASRLIS
jgi:hypothetical protein